MMDSKSKFIYYTIIIVWVAFMIFANARYAMYPQYYMYNQCSSTLIECDKIYDPTIEPYKDPIKGTWLNLPFDHVIEQKQNPIIFFCFQWQILFHLLFFAVTVYLNIGVWRRRYNKVRGAF